MENEKRNNKQNVNYFASQEERLTSKDLNEELINLIERNREISSKIDKEAQDFYNKRDLIAKEKQKVNSNDHLVESVKFEELKKMVESLNKKIDSTNLFLQELKEILYQKSYSKDFINNFILEISNLNIKENWKSDDVLKIKFEKKLSNVLQTINFNNIKGKVIFIGPTGVGKTTTLAKIAAIMKKEQLKIAFVTIDTYRIAATDQLRTYADILDIPLKICYNPQDLKTTVDSLLNYDVILIDTAGRSPKNNLQMGELKVFIDAIKPDYKILLISSNVNCEDMIKTYDSFSFLEPNCLIFTKLDETSSFGQLFSFLEHSKLPLLGITNGQRVPEDLKFPGKEQLVNVALKEVFK
ncbi:GTPase [Petrotoga sp. 9PWA.NaAc.5.4]|uniref:GTP-binding protein n=1 Tax=Petrotoga sp. 9PWA.NaAc.5.4 TaxID=1434328 RepID=UPI000CC454C6|nr:GTPase [Petrotoga sp. 9PWA.NaAc.5.4]PNR97207.1 hypothetical protein X924_00665 [Petrotoga sp. 9PWA.NaAc.5.4]